MTPSAASRIANPLVSVVMPAYNERDTIDEIVRRVLAVPLRIELIVVDDCSTDGTRDLLQALQRELGFTLVLQPSNGGKGSALRAGFTRVTGDIVVIQDADLEYDPQQFHRLIKPIVDGEADVVYGSRFAGSITGMRWQNRLANLILTMTANLLYRAHITDEATCYKAFRADLLKSMPLKCKRFEFCPEVTARTCKRGIRIAEVPIDYVGRTALQGKKIRWTDGFAALWTLIKYRFVD